MVKVYQEIPRTPQGELSVEMWAERVCAEHEHLEAGQLIYVANGLRDRAPDLLASGIELAELVANLNLDQAAVHAAMLYRGIREGRYQEAFLVDLAGTDASRVCLAVAAMATTSLLEMSNSPLLEKEQRDQVDNVKRMLVSMIDDVRVAVLKLAERLLALRRAKDYDDRRRQRVAEEAMEIFAPLAGRLGIWQLKWELEDLALRYTQPEVYQRIAGQLRGKRVERERQIEHMVDRVRGLLRANGIDGTVYGRAKNIFSIWRKMEIKRVSFDQVHDVRAVRVVVNTLAECYAALGVIHASWPHIPSEFDDYIANPKENGYRSIHTAVTTDDGSSLEIQIRTVQMHEAAELGVCAHWSYKEGGVEDGTFGAKMDWLREVINWHDELGGAESLRTLLRHRVNDERIYVSTPKGHVVDLPVDATALDFAYRVHTDIGHRSTSASVNGVAAELNQRLETGQQVTIVTDENGVPRRDWLEPEHGYITTDRARAKLAKYFRNLPADSQLQLGRELFESRLHSLGMGTAGPPDVAALAQALHVQDAQTLWRLLGAGQLSLMEALERYLLGRTEGKPASGFPAQMRFRIAGSDRDGLLNDLTMVVRGMDLALTGTTGRVSIPATQAIITLDVTLEDWRQAIRLVSRLALVDGVQQVERVTDANPPT